jgi:hypothetical protein
MIYRMIAALAWLALGMTAALAQSSTTWSLSFAAGTDVNGNYIGGTEMRFLVPHTIPNGDPFPNANGAPGSTTCAVSTGCPALFAFNGYWEDAPGPEGYQCGQSLILPYPASAGGQWIEDHNFGNGQGGACLGTAPPSGVLAVAAASEHCFTTYGAGIPTPGGSLCKLFAGMWDESNPTLAVPPCGVGDTPDVVADRLDGSGTWEEIQLSCDNAGALALSQPRSFAAHVDNLTGIDRVFAGTNPRGIFSGTLNVNGTITWSANPEPFVPPTPCSLPIIGDYAYWYVGACSNVAPVGLASVALDAPGSGYSVNDALSLNPTSATAGAPPIPPATLTVNSITSSGGIATFTLTAAGAYIIEPTNFTASGGTGSGATFETPAWTYVSANSYTANQWPDGSSGPTTLPAGLTVRVMGLAEATNSSGTKNLYALVGYQIWKRNDAVVSPTWSLFWELPVAYLPPKPGNLTSASGLRGLTVVPNVDGESGQELLIGAESNGPGLMRINISQPGGCSSDMNTCTHMESPGEFTPSYIGTAQALTNALFDREGGAAGPNGGPSTYQIPAYNSPMLALSNGDFVTGQGSIFYAKGASIPPGHDLWTTSVPGITSGTLDAQAYYSIRSVSGATPTWTMYAMPLIAGPNADPPYNISMRGMALSPWASQGDNAVYFSGYDAENTTVHDTGWIVRAPTSVAFP